MQVALRAEQLVKTYGSGDSQVNAVDNVSVDLYQGELVALVGPSGSGKTTLLAMLAGLLRPTSGAIMIEDQDLTTMRERDRAAFRKLHIGFAFQANNLVPYLTALENVELMLRLSGQRTPAGRERARELLVRLGLEERIHGLPRQLSGGQQQRVAIARSLISQPTLVLADEPTASLDSERAFQVVQTFAQLVHEQNRAGILVTHDLRLVEYVDRVIQMLDGRIERILEAQEDLSCLANPERCGRIPMGTLGFSGDDCPCSEPEPAA